MPLLNENAYFLYLSFLFDPKALHNAFSLPLVLSSKLRFVSYIHLCKYHDYLRNALNSFDAFTTFNYHCKHFGIFNSDFILFTFTQINFTTIIKYVYDTHYYHHQNPSSIKNLLNNQVGNGFKESKIFANVKYYLSKD